MMNIYTRFPTDYFMKVNLEYFIELSKSALRSKVNSWVKEKSIIPSSFILRIWVHNFIHQAENLFILPEDATNEEKPIKIMAFEELEEMFREEIEYWVIRRKSPVQIVACGDFIRVKLLAGKKETELVTPYNPFSFKEAEEFILRKFKGASRISISESAFEAEDNLVAVFKIK